MRSLKPWTQMTDPRLEMDRLFDLVFASRLDEFAEDLDGVPSLELTETEDALVLKMEVPGMDATFKNGLLVVTLPKTPAAKGSTVPVTAE
jgi:HSP20 family molecular chaperone IbpA